MTETRVVNMRRSVFDVYIGRAGRGQSGTFGNPFRREDPGCLAKFEAYFLERVVRDPEFRARVLDLRGKVLGCFCKNARGEGPCHGDVIARWVDAQPAAVRA